MARHKTTPPPQAGAYRIHCGPAFYIGSTRDFEKRRNHHLWALKNGKHGNPALQEAFKLHGVMKFERVRICDEGLYSPQEMEQELLDFYAGNPHLCNVSLSAYGPDEDMKERARARMADPTLSAPTREKMAAAKRGERNPNARTLRVMDPQGEIMEFVSVTEAAVFFEVSQQLMDQWVRGIVAWPGSGYRVRKCNAWIAAYSMI